MSEITNVTAFSEHCIDDDDDDINADINHLRFKIVTVGESWIFEITGGSSTIRDKMIDGLRHLIKINNAINEKIVANKKKRDEDRNTQPVQEAASNVLVQHCGNVKCKLICSNFMPNVYSITTNAY